MPDQLTITATTGPAQAVAALIITGVRQLNFNTVDNVVEVFNDGRTGPQQYDITNKNTITVTKATGDWTVSIS